jgi:hypothetical protein
MTAEILGITSLPLPGEGFFAFALKGREPAFLTPSLELSSKV